MKAKRFFYVLLAVSISILMIGSYLLVVFWLYGLSIVSVGIIPAAIVLIITIFQAYKGIKSLIKTK